MSEYPIEQQGFFVKVGDCRYSGPHARLKEARNEARQLGPELEIYHGILKHISGSIVDESQLFLVPKLRKNET
jgi:hypothetical protein